MRTGVPDISSTWNNVTILLATKIFEGSFEAGPQMMLVLEQILIAGVRLGPKITLDVIEEMLDVENAKEVVRNIYTNRSFCVSEGASRSAERKQRSGISQGCPYLHSFSSWS